MTEFLEIPKFMDNGDNNPGYIILLREYLGLTRDIQKTPQGEFIGGMPVTMNNNCFKPIIRVSETGVFEYHITLKADGERYLLFINNDGLIFFIDRSLSFYTFRHQLQAPERNCILDGELVTDNKGYYEFLVFDLLFLDGQSYINYNYVTRFYNNAIPLIEQILYPLFLQHKYLITHKLWFNISEITKTSDIYKYIQEHTNKSRIRYKLKPLISDGLILQPFDKPYITSGPWNKPDNIQYKWKPLEDQTMDFAIKIISNNDWKLLTRSGQEFRLPGSAEAALCKPTAANRRTFSDGDVAEFKYNPRNKLFTILRPRKNKTANSLGTIMSVFNFIENPFKLDDIKKILNTILEGDYIRGVLMTYTKEELVLCCLNNTTGSLFFNPDEQQNISKVYNEFIGLYNNSTTRYELEFRISRKQRNEGSFKYLLEYLYSSYPSTYSETIDLILVTEPKTEGTIRSTYKTYADIIDSKPEINEIKTRISQYSPYDQERSFFLKNSVGKLTEKDVRMMIFAKESDPGFIIPEIEQSKTTKNVSLNNGYNGYQFNLILSSEKQISKQVKLQNTVQGKVINNIIRTKNRWSFNISSLWRIDLTITKTGYSFEELLEKQEKFEIECEFIGNPVETPLHTFIKSFSDVYIFILRHSDYCFI